MTEDVKNQVEQEAAPAVQEAALEAAPEAAPDLTISDLIALRSIVEVVSQRGAFKATELEAVGKTFNKLNTFLESVTKKEE